MSNVQALRPAAPDRSDPTPIHVTAPEAAPDMLATVGKLMADTDWSTAELLPPFHAKTEGIAERINQLNAEIHHAAREVQVALARWDFFGDARTHWAFMSRWMVAALLVTLLVSETALAATVMAGLDLTDGERYLVALGTVAGSTFVVKALAYAWRRRADDLRDRFEPNSNEMIVVWLGVLAVVLVLAGQVLARESFAAQAHADDAAGVSWKVALALTLLQAGLYVAVGVGMFKLLPHVRTHEAECQYRGAQKQLNALHRQRQALAGKLNRHVMTLKADWAKEHAKCRSAVYEHLAEVGRWRDNPLPAFYFDERMLKPVPEWVWPTVDPMPDLVQAWAHHGTRDDTAMAAREQHLELKLLRRLEPSESPEDAGVVKLADPSATSPGEKNPSAQGPAALPAPEAAPQAADPLQASSGVTPPPTADRAAA